MMRDSDTIARLGGDEFVILGEEIESESEALGLAHRVLATLEEPFVVRSAEVSMPASVGVSVAGDPEAAKREQRQRDGIPIPDSLAEKIEGICRTHNVPFLLQ